MNGDLLFVAGSLAAVGLAWIAFGVCQFLAAVHRTSVSVQEARMEAILEARVKLEGRPCDSTDG